MEKAQAYEKRTTSSWLCTGLAACFLLILLVIGAFCFGEVYALKRFEHIEDRIARLEQACKLPSSAEGSTSVIQEREIISASQKPDWPALLRGDTGSPGPVGPPGRDGRDGIPGKDGKDYTSLKLLKDVINETVVKEWTKLSDNLPSYGGSTYIRWGRTICPASSKLLYKGQIAGPDHRSAGGGANFLCLTDDPEYFPDAPSNVPYSTLRHTQYEILFSPKMFGKSFNLLEHQAPCVACEADMRVSIIMIPAVTRCPSSDWTLEYQGYLMSSAERHTADKLVSDFHYKGDYVCVDKNAEHVSIPKEDILAGSVIFPVSAGCSGQGALKNCPPFKTDNTALSCVVCSK